MIKIFGATDKIYTSNGDIVLQSIKAKVHKALNGDFYIDLEAPLTYVDYLVSKNIIVANTPQGEQAFRIGNVDKTKTKIKCKAYHVFYDIKNRLVRYTTMIMLILWCILRISSKCSRLEEMREFYN